MGEVGPEMQRPKRPTTAALHMKPDTFELENARALRVPKVGEGKAL